jgi:hypothetical protein
MVRICLHYKKEPSFTAGTLNTRGNHCGNAGTNKQGEDLEDALVSAELACLNDGKFTRMATRPGDSDSVIDLALVSPTIAPICG